MYLILHLLSLFEYERNFEVNKVEDDDDNQKLINIYLAKFIFLS